MWSDLRYLWLRREQPATFGRWFVVWTKRALYIRAVCQLITKSALFRLRGSDIGQLVMIGRVEFNGKLSNLSIGSESALGRCNIALHHRVTIGRRSVINDGVSILTASHSIEALNWKTESAPVRIGDYAWIATNAIILPGVNIGRGAVVGAGAVVRRDVPDYGVVIGNPARLSQKKRNSELNYSPVLLGAPFEAWVGHQSIKIDAIGSERDGS